MKKEIQVSNEREPTEEMVLAGIEAANRTMPYVSDAQCVAAIWKAMQAANSQAMPQGVEEWVERNKLLSLDAAVEFVVTVEDLSAYLSGMAIVPVDAIKLLVKKGDNARVEIEGYCSEVDKQRLLSVALKTYDTELRPFVELTLEEIEDIIKSNVTITDSRLYEGVYAVAVGIEAALKNKNDGGK